MKINSEHRYFLGDNYWAVILGGSSGIGLACVKKLARSGMNIALIHRDLKTVEKNLRHEMQQLREETGVKILQFNVNAILREEITKVISELQKELLTVERIRVMLHSISKGNLKPMIAPNLPVKQPSPNELTDSSQDYPESILTGELAPPGLHKQSEESQLSKEDFDLTIYAMSTSIMDWTNAFLKSGLFAKDARILGLTSEGSHKYWPGYGAVAAAKASLESIARYMAVEYAPYGLRTNIIQAGTTDTPSMRKIPDSDRLKRLSEARNPFKKLTRPEDVANVICLLCMNEAAWINGTLVHADGGEHCS